MEVPHRRQPGGGDYHHLAPPADLVAGGLPEGLYNDLCLLADVVGVQLFILADKFCRPAGRQVGVVRDGLGDLEAGGIGHVVLQHIQNEPFFNGLPHTVNVERVVAAVRVLGAEQFQRGGFWGGSKGKEGQVLVPSVGGQLLHQRILRVDLVLRFALQLGIFPQCVLGVGKGGFQL